MQEVVVAVSAVAPLLVLVVVLIKCLGCLRKKEGFKNFENEDTRMEARINPGFAMGQDVDEQSRNVVSTSIQIEPLPEILSEITSRKPKIACVEKSKQESALKLVVMNNPHPFPRRQLKYLNEIGTGWFGHVLESDAEHITTGIPLSRVVAKVLTDEASNSEKKLFLEDVIPYRELEHANILRLLGQCTESSPYLMILEHAQMGDLKSCVKQRKTQANFLARKYQLVKFTIDAASGLACLHRHGYIHQDFAARNCLVMADYTVKVGDYGIAEDAYKDDYYTSGKEVLPIRWMAPESLSQQSGEWQTAVITREANIWSFGVLLWEVLMFGSQPYSFMSDTEVLQNVIADRLAKLPEPDIDIEYKDRIAEVMQFCWLNPGQRPSIEEAHGLLQRLASVVTGAQEKEENFEKKWNQLIPSEARIVSAIPQPKQQKRPKSDSFDSDFSPVFKPESLMPNQLVSPVSDELTSVKVEDGLSTTILNMPSVSDNDLALLPTPSQPQLPALMTSTPLSEQVLAVPKADPAEKSKKSNASGSKTSRKIEDDFEKISITITESTPDSVTPPSSVFKEETKSQDVGITIPPEEPDVDLIQDGTESMPEPVVAIGLAEDILGVAISPEELDVDLLKDVTETKPEPLVAMGLAEDMLADLKPAKEDTRSDFSEGVQKVIENGQTASDLGMGQNVIQVSTGSSDITFDIMSNVDHLSKDPGLDLLSKDASVEQLSKEMKLDLLGQERSVKQGDHISVAPPMDPFASLLSVSDQQSLPQTDSSAKCDMQSSVSGLDEPDKSANVGKQTPDGSSAESDANINKLPLKSSSDVDLLSSSNHEKESSVDTKNDNVNPTTFQPVEGLPSDTEMKQEIEEPISKAEEVKQSDIVFENGFSGYETHSVDQSKSESTDDSTTSANESSSDSAVCVSSPELAEAPSSFDGATPSSDKTLQSEGSSVSPDGANAFGEADAAIQKQAGESKMSEASLHEGSIAVSDDFDRNILESRQGQDGNETKTLPKDLNSAFETLASQHNIGLDMFGSPEESAEGEYNDFTFESLGKSSDVNLFDDFPGTESTPDKPEVQSVAAFFTGVDVPKVTGDKMKTDKEVENSTGHEESREIEVISPLDNKSEDISGLESESIIPMSIDIVKLEDTESHDSSIQTLNETHTNIDSPVDVENDNDTAKSQSESPSATTDTDLSLSLTEEDTSQYPDHSSIVDSIEVLSLGDDRKTLTGETGDILAPSVDNTFAFSIPTTIPQTETPGTSGVLENIHEDNIKPVLDSDDTTKTIESIVDMPDRDISILHESLVSDDTSTISVQTELDRTQENADTTVSESDATVVSGLNEVPASPLVDMDMETRSPVTFSDLSATENELQSVDRPDDSVSATVEQSESATEDTQSDLVHKDDIDDNEALVDQLDQAEVVEQEFLPADFDEPFVNTVQSSETSLILEPSSQSIADTHHEEPTALPSSDVSDDPSQIPVHTDLSFTTTDFLQDEPAAKQTGLNLVHEMEPAVLELQTSMSENPSLVPGSKDQPPLSVSLSSDVIDILDQVLETEGDVGSPFTDSSFGKDILEAEKTISETPGTGTVIGDIKDAVMDEKVVIAVQSEHGPDLLNQDLMPEEGLIVVDTITETTDMSPVSSDIKVAETDEKADTAGQTDQGPDLIGQGLVPEDETSMIHDGFTEDERTGATETADKIIDDMLSSENQDTLFSEDKSSNAENLPEREPITTTVVLDEGTVPGSVSETCDIFDFANSETHVMEEQPELSSTDPDVPKWEPIKTTEKHDEEPLFSSVSSSEVGNVETSEQTFDILDNPDQTSSSLTEEQEVNISADAAHKVPDVANETRDTDVLDMTTDPIVEPALDSFDSRNLPDILDSEKSILKTDLGESLLFANEDHKIPDIIEDSQSTIVSDIHTSPVDILSPETSSTDNVPKWESITTDKPEEESVLASVTSFDIMNKATNEQMILDSFDDVSVDLTGESKDNLLRTDEEKSLADIPSESPETLVLDKNTASESVDQPVLDSLDAENIPEWKPISTVDSDIPIPSSVSDPTKSDILDSFDSDTPASTTKLEKNFPLATEDNRQPDTSDESQNIIISNTNIVSEDQLTPDLADTDDVPKWEPETTNESHIEEPNLDSAIDTVEKLDSSPEVQIESSEKDEVQEWEPINTADILEEDSKMQGGVDSVDTMETESISANKEEENILPVTEENMLINVNNEMVETPVSKSDCNLLDDAVDFEDVKEPTKSISITQEFEETEGSGLNDNSGKDHMSVDPATEEGDSSNDEDVPEWQPIQTEVKSEETAGQSSKEYGTNTTANLEQSLVDLQSSDKETVVLVGGVEESPVDELKILTDAAGEIQNESLADSNDIHLETSADLSDAENVPKWEPIKPTDTTDDVQISCSVDDSASSDILDSEKSILKTNLDERPPFVAEDHKIPDIIDDSQSTVVSDINTSPVDILSPETSSTDDVPKWEPITTDKPEEESVLASVTSSDIMNKATNEQMILDSFDDVRSDLTGESKENLLCTDEEKSLADIPSESPDTSILDMNTASADQPVLDSLDAENIPEWNPISTFDGDIPIPISVSDPTKSDILDSFDSEIPTSTTKLENIFPLATEDSRQPNTSEESQNTTVSNTNIFSEDQLTPDKDDVSKWEPITTNEAHIVEPNNLDSMFGTVEKLDNGPEEQIETSDQEDVQGWEPINTADIPEEDSKMQGDVDSVDTANTAEFISTENEEESPFPVNEGNMLISVNNEMMETESSGLRENSENDHMSVDPATPEDDSLNDEDVPEWQPIQTEVKSEETSGQSSNGTDTTENLEQSLVDLQSSDKENTVLVVGIEESPVDELKTLTDAAGELQNESLADSNYILLETSADSSDADNVPKWEPIKTAEYSEIPNLIQNEGTEVGSAANLEQLDGLHDQEKPSDNSGSALRDEDHQQMSVLETETKDMTVSSSDDDFLEEVSGDSSEVWAPIKSADMVEAPSPDLGAQSNNEHSEQVVEVMANLENTNSDMSDSFKPDTGMGLMPDQDVFSLDDFKGENELNSVENPPTSALSTYEASTSSDLDIFASPKPAIDDISILDSPSTSDPFETHDGLETCDSVVPTSREQAQNDFNQFATVNQSEDSPSDPFVVSSLSTSAFTDENSITNPFLNSEQALVVESPKTEDIFSNAVNTSAFKDENVDMNAFLDSEPVFSLELSKTEDISSSTVSPSAVLEFETQEHGKSEFDLISEQPTEQCTEPDSSPQASVDEFVHLDGSDSPIASKTADSSSLSESLLGDFVTVSAVPDSNPADSVSEVSAGLLLDTQATIESIGGQIEPTSGESDKGIIEISKGSESYGEPLNDYQIVENTEVEKSPSNESFSDVSDGFRESSNLGQSIIDFPDSSMTDSQESAVFLDLSSDNDNANKSPTEVITHDLTQDKSDVAGNQKSSFADAFVQNQTGFEDMECSSATEPPQATMPERTGLDEPDMQFSSSLGVPPSSTGQTDDVHIPSESMSPSEGLLDLTSADTINLDAIQVTLETESGGLLDLSSVSTGQTDDVQVPSESSSGGLLDLTSADTINPDVTQIASGTESGGLLDLSSVSTGQTDDVQVPSELPSGGLLDFSSDVIQVASGTESGGLLDLSSVSTGQTDVVQVPSESTSGGLLNLTTTDTINPDVIQVASTPEAEGLLDLGSASTDQIDDVQVPSKSTSGGLLDFSSDVIQVASGTESGGLLDLSSVSTDWTDDVQVPSESSGGLLDLTSADTINPNVTQITSETESEGLLDFSSAMEAQKDDVHLQSESTSSGLLDLTSGDAAQANIVQGYSESSFGGLLDISSASTVQTDDSKVHTNSSPSTLLDLDSSDNTQQDSVQNQIEPSVEGLLDLEQCSSVTKHVDGAEEHTNIRNNTESKQNDNQSSLVDLFGSENSEQNNANIEQNPQTNSGTLLDFTLGSESQIPSENPMPPSSSTSDDSFGGLLDLATPSQTQDSNPNTKETEQTALLDIFGSPDVASEGEPPKPEDPSSSLVDLM